MPTSRSALRARTIVILTDNCGEVVFDKLLMTQIARVIPNGSDIAGTSLSHVNEETLSGMGENVYYLFLCKCALYVECFGVPLYTGMVVRGV